LDRRDISRWFVADRYTGLSIIGSTDKSDNDSSSVGRASDLEAMFLTSISLRVFGASNAAPVETAVRRLSYGFGYGNFKYGTTEG